MPKFINVNVLNAGQHNAQPARIAVDAIAYITPCGTHGDSDCHTKVVLMGGEDRLGNSCVLTVEQPFAQVAALLA